MLTTMRKHKKILNVFLWLVIAAFIGTILLVWGMGEKQSNSSYVAKVDNNVITYENYKNSYENTVNSLRQLLGDSYSTAIDSKEIEKKVLNDLINRQLILKEADRLKIPVSDSEIAASVMQTPAFLVDGVFSIDQYQNTLQYYRLTPAQFEQDVRESIKIEKFLNIVRNSVAVTDEEILYEYKYRNKKIELDYFTIDPKKYADKVVVAPEGLLAYYNANSESYRVPAKATFKYVEFSPKDFNVKPVIDEQAVEQHYANNIESYKEPEQVDLSQILVAVDDWNNEAAVKKAEEKINKAYAELKKGGNFAAVAKKYSEDEATAAAGGALGTVTRDPLATLTPLEETIFNLKAGDISEVVKTDFGYHIFKANSHREAKTYTLDEKRAEIRKSLEADAEQNAYRSALYNLYRDLNAAGNLTAYLEKNPDAFRTKTTSMLTDGIFLAELFSDLDTQNQVFALNKTEISPIITIGDRSYIFEVIEKENSKIPALSEIEGKVTADYTFAQATDLARADILAKSSAVTTEDSFVELAKSLNSKVNKLAPFKKNEASEDMQWAEKLINDLFKLENNKVFDNIYLVDDFLYTFYKKNVIEPSLDNLPTEKDAISAYLLTEKQDAAEKAYLESLKAKSKITINPSFLN